MRWMPKGSRRAWRLVTLSVMLTIGVSACGSSSSTPSSSSSPTSTSASAASTGASQTSAGAGDGVAAADKKLAALYKYQFFHAPPATSPPAQRGKKVWEISVGLGLPASGLFAESTKAAAKALGWNLTVYDAKLDPSLFQDGIRQAIAAKADGILLYNVDCSLARSAMTEAKAAKIPIVGAESLDCSDSKPGDESLFSGTVVYPQGSFSNWVRLMGTAQADWVIAKTRGKAKVITFVQNDLQTVVILNDAFRKELATCATCKLVRTVQFTGGDIGPKLQEKAQQAILQTPDANAIVSPIDDYMTAGLASAIQSSGRKDQLEVIAGGGYAANLEIVRKNQGQNAGYISSIAWEGFGASDSLNRLFAGQKPVDSGNGIGIYDNDHNLGTSGAAAVPIDFVAAYEKAWAGQK
ncbi:MAG: monosaccharide transporter substrate-binding protein family [Conexibacter sp.]|jgi:ribose transport system substrate-binding protein|nr:monosaccharide transporter substrate-binding protein family [Conexibacter sp.]